jgi:hypothetical protein
MMEKVNLPGGLPPETEGNLYRLKLETRELGEKEPTLCLKDTY